MPQGEELGAPVGEPRVVIIGAGPAGLTAALELIRRGGHRPIVVEASDAIGGISRTVCYKGNRMDIGGHRFFSKSDWVMNWWREILPLQPLPQKSGDTLELAYQGQRRTITDEAVAGVRDRSMLVRNRLSRIYFLRRYFDYPIKLNLTTISNLGPVRLLRIGASYAKALLWPRPAVKSLEDFLVNRFGEELYRTFFKDYTEKVWGMPCNEISAEWGAQRIKGLSVIEALRHAWRKRFSRTDHDGATKTSLMEKFLYPRLGPGQLWEEVARRIVDGGGEIRLRHRVSGMRCEGNRVVSVVVADESGHAVDLPASAVISTMAVKDLVAGIEPAAPLAVREIAAALPYRDFITVGLLVARMKANPQSHSGHENNMPPDNWIYVQERDVRLGRIQVFNNWSPDLVADPARIWLGLEYFCQEGDHLWSLDDASMLAFAAAELEQIGMIDRSDVLDGTVIRVPKTYPAYFGAYSSFGVVRDWLDGIGNLFLVGRNGMHRYNNQDHSMLTAKLAADAILSGSTDKAAIWAVNIDDDYHEETESRSSAATRPAEGGQAGGSAAATGTRSL